MRRVVHDVEGHLALTIQFSRFTRELLVLSKSESLA